MKSITSTPAEPGLVSEPHVPDGREMSIPGSAGRPRWLSRKFITAMVAQFAALAALIWPSQGPTLIHAGQDVAALVVLVLTALGYIHAEASIDRQRQTEAKRTPESERTAQSTEPC